MSQAYEQTSMFDERNSVRLVVATEELTEPNHLSAMQDVAKLVVGQCVEISDEASQSRDALFVPDGIDVSGSLAMIEKLKKAKNKNESKIAALEAQIHEIVAASTIGEIVLPDNAKREVLEAIFQKTGDYPSGESLVQALKRVDVYQENARYPRQTNMRSLALRAGIASNVIQERYKLIHSLLEPIFDELVVPHEERAAGVESVTSTLIRRYSGDRKRALKRRAEMGRLSGSTGDKAEQTVQQRKKQQRIEEIREIYG